MIIKHFPFSIYLILYIPCYILCNILLKTETRSKQTTCIPVK